LNTFAWSAVATSSGSVAEVKQISLVDFEARL
jgi:hypothetical protein